MTLGVYSNNFISRDKYAIKDSAHSNNADTDGQNSFLNESMVGKNKISSPIPP